jgi:hypothetical protein
MTPLDSKSTLIGVVGAVTGPTVSIQLSATVESGIVLLEGRSYKVGQVGSFIRIPQGYQSLYGIVADTGASAIPKVMADDPSVSGRWITVQLLGEALIGTFERGISQHPNVGDEAHLVTETDLSNIYGKTSDGQVRFGSLSSAENISVFLDVDKLVTRHCALVGSTGSGKSTTVAALLRTLCASESHPYPSARILILDIHGEYSKALSDVGCVFNADPDEAKKEKGLFVPFWALELEDLLNFLFGALSETQRVAISDKILAMKRESLATGKFPGLTEQTLTNDSPIPFSLHRLWYELIDFELRTFKDKQRVDPDLIEKGDALKLVQPKYAPFTSDNTAPYRNSLQLGIRKQLDAFRSRLLDHKFDFLLHPGDCEPKLDGSIATDIDAILAEWLGHDRPISILDLSGIPDDVLTRLIGTILRVVYDALFWSRKQAEGGIQRPLLIVMEEAHRYISPDAESSTKQIVHRILKEGRKYGIGALVVSQRPSEVDETVLSQCGTFVALRLSNQVDRGRIRSTLADNLSGLTDMLPILRTGEAVVTGEAVSLPMRCRITAPPPSQRPDSEDPKVSKQWAAARKSEDYKKMVAAWRAKSLKDIVSKSTIAKKGK